MISKMNYLLLSTMMIAAIDSTFGRGCDCCKKLCADKGSSGPSINPENNKTTVDEKLIQKNVNTIHNDIIDNIIYNNNFTDNIGNNNNFYNTNENNNTLPENLENNGNSNHKKKIHDEKFDNKKVNEDGNEKTLYFTKIEKTGQYENIEKCFNVEWYKACPGKVLLLQQVNEDGSNVLSVTGSRNNWKIIDQENVLGSAGCNPGHHKWIIVKVTTMSKDSKGVWNSYIFYVDNITNVGGAGGVFENVRCYSIEIIAANTSNMDGMYSMFAEVESALEQDGKEDIGPGLIGLDKLNVKNVVRLHWMFYNAIHKQVTLKQLEKWRFLGKSKVRITKLFYSKVEGLDFRVLDGWNKTEDDGPVAFFIAKAYPLENVFVQSGKEKDFTAPGWYNDIEVDK